MVFSLVYFKSPKTSSETERNSNFFTTLDFNLKYELHIMKFYWNYCDGTDQI